ADRRGRRGERLDAVREVVALGVGGRGGTVAGGFEAGVRAIGGTDTRCQGDGLAKNRGRDGDLCNQRAGADELCGVSSPGVADQQCAGGERDQAIESACEGNGKVLDQRRRRVDASDSRSDPERGWPCGALCPSAPTARSRRGRQPAWTATEVRTSTGLHPRLAAIRRERERLIRSDGAQQAGSVAAEADQQDAVQVTRGR